ncbi:MAG: hypothetical protein O6837_03250 [Deltaproteobacteria bacterium]|nr:hypothetical protein [Deltaproteobacteria bacterium]MCZ6563353.1 hypothetical protein [Deltaproteobacteria bacterium]
MAKGKKKQPKQVVYLFGAGATQAEVGYRGASSVNLLMRDNEELGENGVATRILNRISGKWRAFLGEDQAMDIEKLISLLAASSVESLSGLAEKMRRLYFWEIRTSLVLAKVIQRPKLATALLEMHSNDYFRKQVETLSGILTTNHDGLLQISSQEVFKEVNLGFPFVSEELTPAVSNATPPLLQLHGSFTWRFAVPIEVTKLRRDLAYSPETIWIPPTILKESKNYPFNKVTGLAYELLAKQCDVLRVVGSSLTQNDWNVLSLIFNAQRHRELVKGAAFRIELVMPHDYGEKVKQDCSYLKNITPIGYLTEGDFGDYKELNLPPDDERNNVFAYWLKEKIYYHRNRDHFGDTALGRTMAQMVGETI